MQNVLRHLNILAAIILAVLLPGALWAQFLVESTYPPDGTVQFDPSQPLRITFNQPLDATMKYQTAGDFYVAYLLIPSDRHGTPQIFNLSPDGKTLEIADPGLQPNTPYQLAILAAQNIYGDAVVPWVTTFTTGDTLPSGRMTGFAGVPNANNYGTIVALYRYFMDEEPAHLTIVQDWTGAYTMEHITGGIYYPMACMDLDRDGDVKFDFLTDAIGFYDLGTENIPKPTMIAEGWYEPVVDLPVSGFIRTTARESFQQIKQWLISEAKDHQVYNIQSEEVLDTGLAFYWNYELRSATTTPECVQFFVTSNFIMPTVPSSFFTDSLAVPPVWIDSDAAADTAYYYAGYEFCSQHPDAHTLVSLQMMDLSQPLLPKMMHSGIGNKEPTLTKQQSAQATSSWQRQPVWFFSFFYDESMDYAYAMVDALSGRILRYLLMKETSAMYNMSNVAGQAYLWAGDAELVLVVSNDDGLDPSGLCRIWDYYFYSPSLNTVRKYIFSNGGFIDGYDVPDYIASKAVITGFEDSPLAFAVAEQNGGWTYRQANADCQVEAQLSYNLIAETPGRLIWKFTYQSAIAAPLVLYVDANDNSFITGIARATQTSPQDYRLEQNYPNPFNAVTTIAYHLPHDEEVAIDIIDVRGSTLRTLETKKQSAGTQRVVWDGTIADGMPAASGLYFVRMLAGTRVLTKKIMLLR